MPDVTALATAFLRGQINPSYSPIYAMMGYSNVPQQLPSFVNCDLATTQQVASLLGGSVVMANPGNYQFSGTPPQVPWVSISGGMFRVGDVFPPGVVLSYPDLCGAATGIAQSIPNGTVGSSCIGTGNTLTASQYQVGATTPITGANETNTIPIVTTNSVSGGSNTSIPVGPNTSVAAPSNTQTNTTNTTVGQNNGSAQVEGNVFTDSDLVSGVPNWVFMAAGVLALMLVVKH